MCRTARLSVTAEWRLEWGLHPLAQSLTRRRRRSIRTVAAASGGGAKVCGIGGVGIDYLAVVDAFPKPEDKIRTTSFEVQGGGNCGNCLTGAAKLGLQPFILTKVGDDSLGAQILSQFESDGIDTRYVVVGKDCPSAFTYIIVDATGNTRTCIHTPTDPLLPSELDSDVIGDFLEGAALVFFDGRLTEGAIKVARIAREKQIPVLVEAERPRLNLEELIELADVIVTSKHFSQDFSGSSRLGDGLVTLLESFPTAKIIVTALGEKGSVALERFPSESNVIEAVLEERLETLRKELGSLPDPSGEPCCVSKNGKPIRYGTCVESHIFQPTRKQPLDVGNDATGRAVVKVAPVRVTMATAAQISQDAIVDTTGAGDAFNAGVVYGIVQGLPLPEVLRFSSVVAACKCTEIGARAGQPRLGDIAQPEARSAGSVV